MTRVSTMISSGFPHRLPWPQHDDRQRGAVESSVTSIQSPVTTNVEPDEVIVGSNTAGTTWPALSPEPAGTDDGPGALARTLHRVGLGDEMVASVTAGVQRGASLETLLLEAFSTIVPAPALPCQTGSLLVVVGAGAPARRLGAALADEIGINPTEVVLASLDPGAYALATGTFLLRSAEQAAARAQGWRCSRAAVVVVDASMTDGDRSWASHLITTLRPTAVWGVVDAASKSEDIAAWAEALGGLDALALENTDATVSPAAALGAGIAVARINGQPATAARWAATIVNQVRPWPSVRRPELVATGDGSQPSRLMAKA
jgi:hypothetical protein